MQWNKPVLGYLVSVLCLFGCHSKDEPLQQTETDPELQSAPEKPARTPMVIPKDFALEMAQKIDAGLFRDLAIQDVSLAIIRAGEISEALKTAKEIQDVEKRLPLLSAATKMAATKGEFERRSKEILAIIDDPSLQSTALEAVAESLVETGQIDLAESVAEKIDDPSLRISALTKVASSRNQAGQSDQAFEILNPILSGMRGQADPDEKDPVLEAIVSVLANLRQLDEAIQFAAEIENQHRKISSLHQIALASSAAKQKDRANEVLDRSFKLAKQIEDPFFQAEALAMISPGMAHAGKLNEVRAAIEALPTVGSPPLKPWAYAEIGSALLEAGEKQEASDFVDLAVTTSRQAIYKGQRALPMKIIALAKAKAGDVDAALQALQTIDKPFERGPAALEVALILKQRGAGNAELSRFSQGLTVPYDALELSDRVSIWSDFAAAHVIAKNRKQARDILLKARDWARLVGEPVRLGLFNELAVTAAALRDNDLALRFWLEGLQAVEQIEDESDKVDALNLIAFSLAMEPVLTHELSNVGPMKSVFTPAEGQLARQIAESR